MMSADDQAFLDILSSVPNDIRRYSNDVADYVDKHLEKVSNTLREALSSSSWLPESARPRPLQPPPPTAIPESTAPAYTQIYNWVMKNKIMTAVIVLAVGGVTYHFIRRKSNRKKRRAKRASNGARLEVVVVAGQPSEPMTRSICLDLERRGFIVYVVCHSIEEEVLVQNESRPDIKPLMVDIVDPDSAHAAIQRFTAHLQTPHAAFPGAKPHHLSLRSFILVPSTTYPSSPIATLSPSTLSELTQTRLLAPIYTLQSFLPLLQSLPLPHPTHHQTSSSSSSVPKPSILVLTPSIISSLTPSFHAPESTLVSALSAFTSVLASELSPLGIPVSRLQLGTFDFSTFSSSHSSTTTNSPRNQQLQTVNSQRAETLTWDESSRQVYARNFVRVTGGTTTTGKQQGKWRRGSSPRELNDAVFDAMVSGKGRVIRVGVGSQLYGFIGTWVPAGIVGWMMGMRKVQQRHDGEFGGRSGKGVLERSPSPGSERSGGGGGVTGLGESEYISVHGEREREGEEPWRISPS